jgi:hypothetical protein
MQNQPRAKGTGFLKHENDIGLSELTANHKKSEKRVLTDPVGIT